MMFVLACGGGFWLPSPAVSDSSAPLSMDDENEMSKLMAVLDKHTHIATKTKMNADYVPGIVTVLHRDDLLAKGKRNIHEALALVPGIDIAIDRDGSRFIVTRGVGSSWFSGSTVFLLDSIPMNSSTFATASSILDLSVDQVERIEVIRGPGAAVHGEFAYSGVINIVTRKAGNYVAGSVGSNDSHGGTGGFSWLDDEQDLKLSLNVGAAETDGANSKFGPDAFGNYGVANELREINTVFLTITYDDFTLLGHVLTEAHGDHFGVLPIDGNHISARNRYNSLEARQEFIPFSDLVVQGKAGWMEYRSHIDKLRLTPDNYPYTFPDSTIITYPDGVLTSVYSKERKLYGELEFTWKGIEKHTLLLATSYTAVELVDSWLEANYDPATWQAVPMQRFTGENNFIDEDSQREFFAVTMQDEFRVTDRVTVTAGLRYDHYDDVESIFSPRLAAVWQVRPHHIIKAQYARAFRPPSLMEMYGSHQLLVGNPDLEEETVDTYELGYIYRQENTVARATLFYSRLKDIVTYVSVAPLTTFDNTCKATLQGVEMEFSQKFGRMFSVDGNISYTDGENKEYQADVPDAAMWLANLGVSYTPRDDMDFSMLYRFVSDRNRDPADSRNDLDGYDVVDLTASFFDILLPGVTVRAGIKNMFAEDIRYPSPMRIVGTIPDDYPVQSRQWWTKVSYDF